MAEIPRFDPTIRIPASRGVRFQHGPNVGEALSNLGGSVQRLSAAVEDVERRKQHARDMNSAYTILNETELGIAEDMSALRREGPESGVFRTRGDEKILARGKSATERINALKDEKVRAYATGQLGTSVSNHRLRLVSETDGRFVDEDRGITAANAEQLKNRAINATDDVTYAQARQQLHDMYAGKGGNTMKREEAGAAILKAEEEIASERLKKQIRQNPDMVEDVLGGAAGRGMPDHQKDDYRTYADAVIRKRVEQDNRVLDAAERTFKAYAENVEIEVQEAARLRTISKDQIADIARRTKGPRGSPIFTAERVSTLQKALDDAGNTTSDPLTMQNLGIAIQNATSVAQLDAVSVRVDSAYRLDASGQPSPTGLVNKEDWRHLTGRIHQYRNELKDSSKVTYKEAHDTVLKEINAYFRINPEMGVPEFDDRAQGYYQTLRELNAASFFRNGNQDPRDWWDENRARVAVRATDLARKQIDVRMRDLSPVFRQGWQEGVPPGEDIIRLNLRTLEKMKGTVTPDEYRRSREAFHDVLQTSREYYRLYPATAAPKTPPKTLGR